MLFLKYKIDGCHFSILPRRFQESWISLRIYWKKYYAETPLKLQQLNKDSRQTLDNEIYNN